MISPNKKFKICVSCGRKMAYRKRWARCWDQIKHCSDQCRKKRKDDFELKIISLLQSRGLSKTICPSEVLATELKQDKAAMENVRSAARRLADQGLIQILQKGTPIDPTSFKGPIRLKLVRKQ